MNGITSLIPQAPQPQGPQAMPGQNPMQGQMPGQAPQLQAALPQQPRTPQAMVGPLEGMPLEQLIGLAQNPSPNGPPLYAVIAAIDKKQKQAQMQAAMQRQMAMGQGQQIAQQPPVAQQVLAQAQQGIAQPRMGVEDYKRQAMALIDQGRVAEGQQLLELAKEQEQREFTRQQAPQYAGGGLVALRDGGALRFQYGGASLPRFPGETDEQYIERMGTMPRQPGESDYAYQRRIYSANSRQSDLATPEIRPGAQQLEQQVRVQDRGDSYSTGIDEALAQQRAARRVQQGAAGQGQQRQQPRPQTGIMAGLMGPEAPPGYVERIGAQSNLEKSLREAARLPEEARTAREQADAVRRAIGEMYGTEETRRTGAMDKMVADAQARLNADRLSNPEILGRMLRGAMAGGRKASVGEILAGAGAGAAEGVSALQAGVTAAEKERTLGQERLFDLRMKRQDLALAQANLNEARATGDKQRIDAAEVQVAQSQQAFAEAQRKAVIEQQELGFKGRQVGAAEKQAEAAMLSALKPTGTNELLAEFKRDPEGFARFVAAQTKPLTRDKILENYADNWEKLSLMQKEQLKAQGITSLQDYVRYRDALMKEAMGGGASGGAGDYGTPPPGAVKLKGQ